MDHSYRHIKNIYKQKIVESGPKTSSHSMCNAFESFFNSKLSVITSVCFFHTVSASVLFSVGDVAFPRRVFPWESLEFSFQKTTNCDVDIFLVLSGYGSESFSDKNQHSYSSLK